MATGAGVRRCTPGDAGGNRGGGPGPSLPVLLLLPAPADAGVDEAVDIAVEHGVGAADLVAGAQVLDHLVGVEDVGAHLVAPGRLDVPGQLLLPGVLIEIGRASCRERV